MTYEEFLRSKIVSIPETGFAIDPEEINPRLKPHTKDMVRWAVAGGRRAIFAAFGLHKTVTQLEIMRLLGTRISGLRLITLPLGVRQEFFRDAENHFTDDCSLRLKFIRTNAEIEDDRTIYLTNYESVREGKLDPQLFDASSLDEASCLRGFGGSKTFREFMKLFAGDDRSGVRTDGVKYRFVATATPSPNEYIELLAYSAYLDIMDVSQAKTRFFKRDSTKADKLTIHPHKEREFWLWVASWALFVQRPSDLGHSDEGYELPDLDVRWHEVPTDHSQAGFDRSGQGRLIADAAIGVQDAAREKRLSLSGRIGKLMELRAEAPAAHRIIWHDLEAERDAIEKAVPEIVTVYGNQDLEDREKLIIDFSDGKIKELAGKPQMLGSGCNFQRHCSWAVYLGIGFKFNDWIQSVHRLQRFLQKNTVRIDLIYTEAERKIRQDLERKWTQHREMVAKMTEIIKEFGLSQASHTLVRALGVERVEITGPNHRIVNNDCVDETKRMEENSVGLILTSIPFSTQYEYSPNFADFGHTDDNEHFFRQMDYLTPELLRVLKPGRIAAIHVKDRIVPGGMTGLGFQTVYPFHCRTIEHYTRHGFAYMGMKTIVTDVVRENNQTYRLGWTEQCKDGTKMGVGMPEYLLLFRKPPTDRSNGYADDPVVKRKPDCVGDEGNRTSWERGGKEVIGDGYSRGRWQVDAHGFTRSSGDRLLEPEELEGLTHAQIFQFFRDYSFSHIYNFEHHVKIGEHLQARGMLPVTFMLLQPQSWHPDVWTDITRMLTLNGAQSAKGREMHLCPMQFDLADRAIEQWSMEGETVYDPFGGLMTVPYRAIKKKRFGVAAELSERYFLDGAGYCAAAEQEVAMPSLLDLMTGIPAPGDSTTVEEVGAAA